MSRTLPATFPTRHASCSSSRRAPSRPEGHAVMDVVFVTATLAFFALSWGYARACDRV